MNPLARMALHRTPTRGRDMPHVPDNRDRLRTYRAIAPVQLGNAYPWRFHGSQSGANPGPSNPAGCRPDPDDSRDWDGRPLTYAELSRGW